MEEMDDLPLDPDPPLEREPEPRPLWPWVAGLLIVAAVVAGLLYMRRPAAPTPPDASKPAVPAPAIAGPLEPRAGLGPEVEPVELPPLDVSDAAVRELVKALSTRPELMAWLTTDNLIRNLAVCIDNVADGKTPAKHLKVLTPKGAFLATGVYERYTAQPASYQRYDGIAQTVGVLEMNAVARLYALLKPRLDEAYRELGHGAGDIDAGVERALVHLLETPAVPGDAPLTRVVLSYRYEDDAADALSGAQKQLLRMGPRNAQTVQTKLRELAAALGIPADRLR
jgi:hypothetical protein